MCSNRKSVSHACVKFWLYAAIVTCMSAVARGQAASLNGQVFDETGAVVPKATVTLRGQAGQTKTATTSNDGSCSFTGLQPGQYTIQASAPKLASQPVAITMTKGFRGCAWSSS